jgi:hypothetical protein
MEHFKVNFDQTWDYAKIAQKMFLLEPYQCLVMKEHANMANTHVHFQGYTKCTPASFSNKRKRLAKHHYTRKTDPKSRPISACKRACDSVDFHLKDLMLKMLINYLNLCLLHILINRVCL